MTRVTNMLRNRDVVIAVTGLTLILLIAILGSLLAPYSPLKLNADAALQAPSPTHWLGTDYIGRDVLSRLLAGAQLSLLSAVEAVVVGLILGVIPGLISVYGPRSIEWLTLRFSDAILALPFIVFAISFAAVLGNGLHQAMFAVGILFAPSFYRVTRAAVLETNNEQYIEASLFLGASTTWIITRHVWSKVAPTIAVTAVNALAGALLVVSSLTFLGIGVQPPTPTWGGMLASDLNYLSQRPDGPVAPAVLIMITVALLNLLADSIRDVSDRKHHPRTPRRKDAAVDSFSTLASENLDNQTAPSFTADSLVTISQLTIQADATGESLVNNVSFSVARGGTLGIVGESGSGKSLTCRALLGVLPEGVSVSRGGIDFDGIDIRTASPAQWRALRGRRIASVFQDPASYINPSIAVGKQLEEVLKATLGLRRAERRLRAAELLTAVGLRNAELVRRQYAHELSGGMLQRVMIAMAIAAEPDLLIADEATTALDVTVQAEVLALLEELRISHNLTLILVSHDLAVVSAVCDRIVVFRNGEIIEEGTSTEVLTGPRHPYTRELIRGHQRYGLERIFIGASVLL